MQYCTDEHLPNGKHAEGGGGPLALV
jgi:hypothetical protein